MCHTLVLPWYLLTSCPPVNEYQYRIKNDYIHCTITWYQSPVPLFIISTLTTILLKLWYGRGILSHRNLWDVTVSCTLQWRHNERDGVSNHQPHDWIPNRLFKRRSKKISKPRVTGLCEGNSPMTGEFSAQSACNAGNVSIWWRHHDMENWLF